MAQKLNNLQKAKAALDRFNQRKGKRNNLDRAIIALSKRSKTREEMAKREFYKQEYIQELLSSPSGNISLNQFLSTGGYNKYNTSKEA